MNTLFWRYCNRIVIVALVLWMATCAAWAGGHHLHGEDGAPLWYAQGATLGSHFHPSQPLRLSSPGVVRVGMRWDGPAHLEWEVRFSQNGRDWTTWQSVQTTWSTGQMHNSHADPPGGFARWAEVRILNEAHPTFVAIEMIARLGPLAKGSVPSPPPILPLPTRGILGISGPYNPRSAWGAKAAKCSSKDPSKTRIAIHHTVTPNGDTQSPEARLRGIQAYHQGTQGWCDIGYHLLISQDGRAWEGRPADTLGSNVANNNSKTLGISFMGTFTSVTPNNKMLCTGAKLIDWAVKTFGIKRDRSAIMGHRQFPQNSTSCPGDKLYAEISQMIRMSSQSGTCKSTPPPNCDYVKPARLGGVTLNIRKDPTAQSTRLGDVPEGVCLKVLSKNTNGQSVNGDKTWYKITYNNVTGWISGYYADCSDCRPKDTEPPKITIATPKNGATLRQTPVTVTGSVSDNEQVSKAEINGAPLSLDNKGGFRTQVKLTPGSQTIRVKAWDKANNQGTAQITVIYLADTEPPKEPGSTPEPNKEPGPVQESIAEAHPEPQTSQEPGPDSGTTSDIATTTDNAPVRPDDAPLVLDDSARVVCQKPQDCPVNYICDNGYCRSATSPNLQTQLGGGCACQSQSAPGMGALFLLVLLGWFALRRQGSQNRTGGSPS